MIKLEHTVLATNEQMVFVIEGMRNPKNSWDRSDSFGVGYGIGSADLNLMKTLAKAGPVHRKYMRMIPVYVRITAPLYWWKEFDTYKVGTVANSCSTMHKLTYKKFESKDFSNDYLIQPNSKAYKLFLQTIDVLNYYRDLYLAATDEEYKKTMWQQMIQLLPSSYNQTRNVMLNYEVLANIYEWRKDHKLDEWKAFCKWIEDLPHSELITGKFPEEDKNE